MGEAFGERPGHAWLNGTGDAGYHTSERIDQLLAIWPIYSEIDERYVTPALVVSAEKNGLSNGPNGTSEGAPNTAEDAPS
ncbi:hypothetical protein MGN01_43660 [Methylobacterium gnaphalii]|uniref:Uncharacterized protein n=1 Tax=Methylobacterium gnaphalii TaxID=1010610 RepID=A0A512JRF4_9HYPH|nr:hypothetical protein MGN01_43660 [Methylobacterium gnaphalii]GLS51482.1 hypothetical protein GCM10007885_43390 [Methylobacterium gnaphalii]